MAVDARHSNRWNLSNNNKKLKRTKIKNESFIEDMHEIEQTLSFLMMYNTPHYLHFWRVKMEKRCYVSSFGQDLMIAMNVSHYPMALDAPFLLLELVDEVILSTCSVRSESQTLFSQCKGIFQTE